MPSTGTVTIALAVLQSNTGAHVSIQDEYEAVKYDNYTLGSKDVKAPGNVEVYLEEGIYYLFVQKCNYYPADYYLTVSYEMAKAESAKITSLTKGKLKVTYPKGSHVDGYEVRYKKTGDKEWKVETVKSKKTLNKTFSNMKSKKNIRSR